MVNSCPSTGVSAPCAGSTRLAKPSPMVNETLWPAKASASKASRITMPMATPMNTSWTAASAPAAENTESPGGTGASGPRMKARPKESAIFTGPGIVASLAIGALTTKPPTRSTGHHRRATHCEMSATLRRTGCIARSADHCRDAGVQVAGEIDEHPQDPRSGDEQRQHQHQQLRNEA